MKPKYLKIVEHYEACLRKYGDNHLGVDWPVEEDASLRYSVMLDIIHEYRKCTLLDFGCGAAHLLDFIQLNKFEHIIYTGLDISAKYISLCRKKFPEGNFIRKDILEDTDDIPDFDYIIMNGVFTEKRELSFPEMYSYFKKVILSLYKKANTGMAFNVMSKQVDWERDDLFHLPLDLLAEFLTKKVTRHFVIRNDYGLYEYTIYLFKQPLTWLK